MLAEILAYNKSALCRSASPALSFVLYFNVIIKALINFSNCIMLRLKCKHVSITLSKEKCRHTNTQNISDTLEGYFNN